MLIFLNGLLKGRSCKALGLKMIIYDLVYFSKDIIIRASAGCIVTVYTKV